MYQSTAAQILLCLLAAGSSVVDGLVVNSDHPQLNYRFPQTTTPQRFEINVDRDLVDQAQRKARDYRSSPSVYAEWTREGPPEDAVKGLAKHWATKYNWKNVEKKLNRDFKHYATTVPGNRNYTAPIPLHFVHEKSKDKNAIPLLLIHGWSSTYLEWAEVIKPLVANKGGRSYHIVAVDLPGFGFSPSPTLPGLGPREIGLAFDALMKQLGYATYGIVSTDIGWLVATWQTVDATESVIGHYTDFFLASATPEDRARQANNETTEEENTYIKGSDDFFTIHGAYATAQTFKPQALALPMTDSPVGYAAWLWDLKYGSSDGYDYTYDELITETFLSWIQEPYGSMRAYKEISQPYVRAFPKTDVPTGVTQWGSINGPFEELAEFPFAPRSWIERGANLVYFERFAFGGHFPAISQSKLWIGTVQKFFSSL
ncbi:hypothetical protein ACHAQA_005948 [Verticillium albo-atrum]